MKYYHLYSNHLSSALLFRSREDFEFFINRLALLVRERKVKVYAYCLMSNHIHLLVSGEESDILALFRDLRRTYAQYLGYRYEGNVSLDDFTPELREVTSPEDFRTTVAYILRNPQAAGVESVFAYEWSSAFLYFNPRLSSLTVKTPQEYGKVHFREQMHTRVNDTEGILMLGDYISPAIWCDYKTVERFFGRSLDYMKYLSNWNAERDYDCLEGNEHNAHPDSYIVEQVESFCNSHGCSHPAALEVVTRRQLIRLLHRKFGASVKQIQRQTGEDEQTIRRFI